MKKTLKLLGFFLFLLSISQPVLSHGTVIYPPSRIYNCFNNPSSSVCVPCGNAIYDWMGVLQPDTNFGNHQALIPDGQIASGGNGSAVDFSCLNALTTDWPTTRVDHGYIDVRWRNTAPHKTQYFKVYITQLNWDPTKPLRWNDLIEIGHVGQGPAESFTTIRSFIPDSYAGKRAALVSIWQRDYNDSHEAFYSVSDIVVNRNDGECSIGDATNATFANNTDCTLQYYQNNSLQGSANAGGSYTANTTIGSQWETRDSSGNQIGNFTIVCDQTTYTSTGECNEGGGGCDGLNNWSSDAIYVISNKVVYNEVEYEAKWWNTGKNPAQNSGQWEVWKNLGSCISRSNDNNKSSQVEELNFIAFPNPAKDILNLEIYNLRSSSTISIKNINGKTVETIQLKTPEGTAKVDQIITLNNLSSGIYFIHVTTKSKTLIHKVFVK
ncbi:lytic polysaccharide monooxygenase [Aquimarina sp. 2201CG14-23]|uniref:lytic polysaccharide monooxygenase n=1 Tax=Aquimarina mycalae TaxID=3040073 RepID=UPI002477DB5A|nr:lytic polysaccharide monooxygenase [Aquimarina sp. 2201CG14-23]MDH7444536.1 lytic polysaccharide monooxygenase [Aquimarina sp. 2201CG14-23]